MFGLKYCLLLSMVWFHPAASQNLNEGDYCSLASGRGVCAAISRCISIYQDEFWNIKPLKLCDRQDNVVCCPENKQLRDEVKPATTEAPLSFRSLFARDRLAERMCAEYAKMYTQVQSDALANYDNQRVPRIIGGVQAEAKEFPYMAALGYIYKNNLRWGCGGTLISDRYVLTAAHCIGYTDNLGNVEVVRLGDINLSSDTDDAHVQQFRVVERIRYPFYDGNIKMNDLGLLKLDRQVKFNEYVGPACLSTRSDVSGGEKTVTTGWGLTDFFDDEGSDVLLKVNIPVVSHQECFVYSPRYGEHNINLVNKNTHICAWSEGKDTCFGDSGGPLIRLSKDTKRTFEVIGITSFGKYCGHSPGVYTKIEFYLPWIEKIVWRQF